MVGGLLGNQVGNGNGKTLATIAGALPPRRHRSGTSAQSIFGGAWAFARRAH
ncbi:glycine zipper 2TM domain-containing protein [Variovorax sp. HW608]|uniref:glycine zipper 2TM domain-containing protein n=1 Tax=Variovorax sp. HW608 TaxID=1034889 RepID=UPI0022B253F8|nr:glycine zipper 2TM domain-containing protein [Variovorax sp. HW608]